jgi:hypothetical protein
MARSANIFHKLVANEDSYTELLCNLMRYSAFRRPLLSRILSEESAQHIDYDDIDTQVVLPDSGRPDIVIDSDSVYGVVEVKVDLGRGLTANQPDGYFRHLASKSWASTRWLVFLLPPGWDDGPRLKESLVRLEAADTACGVRTRIVDWHDVLDIIESNDLQALNPFFDEFHDLLEIRFRPRPIVFMRKEVSMLFSKDIPIALSKLDKLIDQIQEKGSTYKLDRKRSRGLPGDEHGIYFKDDQENQVLWFGVWTDFWKAENIPLCFGVSDKWPPEIRQAFHSAYKGSIKSFEGWKLGWVTEQSLASENLLEEVWNQLAPVLVAVVQARQSGTPRT